MKDILFHDLKKMIIVIDKLIRQQSYMSSNLFLGQRAFQGIRYLCVTPWSRVAKGDICHVIYYKKTQL